MSVTTVMSCSFCTCVHMYVDDHILGQFGGLFEALVSEPGTFLSLSFVCLGIYEHANHAQIYTKKESVQNHLNEVISA